MLVRGRKRTAKNDALDAASIATRTLPIEVTALTIPRSGDDRQALRVLLTARTQMTRSTTAMINALTALVRTGDLGVDARHPLSKKQIRHISAWRTRETDTYSQTVARSETKRLATTITGLWEDTKENLETLDTLTQKMSPALRAMIGVGPLTCRPIPHHLVTPRTHPLRSRLRFACRCQSNTRIIRQHTAATSKQGW